MTRLAYTVRAYGSSRVGLRSRYSTMKTSALCLEMDGASYDAACNPVYTSGERICEFEFLRAFGRNTSCID